MFEYKPVKFGFRRKTPHHVDPAAVAGFIGRPAGGLAMNAGIRRS